MTEVKMYCPRCNSYTDVKKLIITMTGISAECESCEEAITRKYDLE